MKHSKVEKFRTFQAQFCIKTLQFVSLLAACDFPKLLLWDAARKPFQTTKYLRYTLCIENVPLRLSAQCLDLRQAVSDQMRAQPVINLFENQFSKLCIFSLSAIENLVYETSLKQLFR